MNTFSQYIIRQKGTKFYSETLENCQKLEMTIEDMHPDLYKDYLVMQKFESEYGYSFIGLIKEEGGVWEIGYAISSADEIDDMLYWANESIAAINVQDCKIFRIKEFSEDDSVDCKRCDGTGEISCPGCEGAPKSMKFTCAGCNGSESRMCGACGDKTPDNLKVYATEMSPREISKNLGIDAEEELKKLFCEEINKSKEQRYQEIYDTLNIKSFMDAVDGDTDKLYKYMYSATNGIRLSNIQVGQFIKDEFGDDFYLRKAQLENEERTRLNK